MLHFILTIYKRIGHLFRLFMSYIQQQKNECTLLNVTIWPLTV